MARIRKEVFRCDQTPFGAIAGVSQGTVSRWENGASEPNRSQMKRIRKAAYDGNLLWNDAWFFDDHFPEQTR